MVIEERNSIVTQPDLLRTGINILIDGQFGSTGKGLFAGWLGHRYPIDLAITNSAPNAGHTYKRWSNHDHSLRKIETKVVAYHLPISGIVNKNALIYLCAGSIIDPYVLIGELVLHKIDPWRIVVHPRAAWLTPDDKVIEENEGSPAAKIASTRKGVGQALMRKIERSAKTISDCDGLRNWVTFGELDPEKFNKVLMEVPQGMDLSINGPFYPYCTSREISVSQALSDLQVHPILLGNVILTLRTYPIRVGGTSGGCWPDQHETTWAGIGQEPEYTTVTKRERRVFTFSMLQAEKALNQMRPSVVFLNFTNYIKKDQLEFLVRSIWRIGGYIGLSPRIFTSDGPLDENIREIERF